MKLILMVLALTTLSACGTVKEKTAPCKRPAELTAYAEDPRRECPVMRPVNDPAASFRAIGLE